MSLHDQIMQSAATPMLVEQLGDREALLISNLREGPAIKLAAIVTHEQVVPSFDEETREFSETITRQAHVPLSELKREILAEIPSRTEVEVSGVMYVAGQSRLSGSFQTVELKRTELVRQNTGEAGEGAA